MSRSNQLTFDDYGEAYARSKDPSTSSAAAESVRGEPATRMEAMVLAALVVCGNRGATSHELVEHTGLTHWSLSPRIRPLVRKGYVIDSGDRRPGPSGRACIVWKDSSL